MLTAILTRGATQPVSEALRAGGETAATVHTVEAGGGPAALAEAARTPTDTLLLDLDTGPTASDVARFRLAQPQARVILLAVGRKPGDQAVASISAVADVRDIVDDLAQLGHVLDHPADLASALRWRDPSLAPDVAQAQTVREVVRERRVAVSTRPVIVAVAGVAAGVGTTTVACAAAAFLARGGHQAALVEANPQPSLRILAQASVGEAWVPGLTVYPEVSVDAIREIEQSRQYPYIVCDLGAPPRSVLAQIDADLLLLVLPRDVHRWPRVRAWLHQHADAARAQHADDQALDEEIRQDRALPNGARYVLVSPTAADARDLAAAWEQATERCIPPPSEPLQIIPISDRTQFPAGYRHRDEPLDEALSHLLAPVLPDQPARARRGLFGGFRSRPRPRRLPPAAEDRNPEPARPKPAPAPRAPATRAGGAAQHITVRVGDGASALDRIAAILEGAWRLALLAAAGYGVLYVLSRIPGAPPWALHGYGWAHGVLAAAWRLVGGH